MSSPADALTVTPAGGGRAVLGSGDAVAPNARGTPANGNRAATVLRDVFGFPSFRPQQQEIIEHVTGGGSCFILMPTGGGKSLCYQIPALLRPGVGIVVSPLISLMKDQVDALRANGVRAEFYNSSLESAEARRVLARLHAGELDLLYVAPERLMTDAFIDRLRGDAVRGDEQPDSGPQGAMGLGVDAAEGIPIALFAIDEAHCVSQWGHDFRPEYIDLGRLRGLFPGVPVVACTATADPETRDDVRRRLGLADAPLYVAGFDRPNIRYTVFDKSHPSEQLLSFLKQHEGEAGIVYCLSRKRTEEVAERLAAAGLPAAAYHAGLPASERERVQEAFVHDEILIVVATVAFGMGIDKPDVRFVVHYDLPKTIESYYQETGRAGRDGLPAEALLLFGLADVGIARGLIEMGDNAERNRIEAHKLNAMVGFAEATTCRRRVLLGYFGERLDHDCGNCDVCLDPPETYEATEDARKALSCVYRLRQRFGMGQVIDVLRGAETERVKQLGHDGLSTYGIGADQSHDAWASLIRQLIHRGYLVQDIADYSVLKLTPAAMPLLRGEETLTLARPRTRVARSKAKKPRGSALAKAAATTARAARRSGASVGTARRRGADSADVTNGGAPDWYTGGRPAIPDEEELAFAASSVADEDEAGEELLDYDEELFARLRALRKRLAGAQHVPAYVVFGDVTLLEMAARKPTNDEELLEITGVGRHKLARYGPPFLATINGGDWPPDDERPAPVDGLLL